MPTTELLDQHLDGHRSRSIPSRRQGTYRAEIDGLRALAVVPVILFHAGFRAFRGGFVGVDVFFVISGFLITSLIVAEREAGSFTLARFYERRARRILPAFFVVAFASLPFAWMWLWPADMKNFCQSLLAVSGFVSNVWLWRTSGYFDSASELKPLLHTWSLGVEEQFYLLFPLLLLLVWQWGRRWAFVLLAAVALLTFGGAYWGIERELDWLVYHRVPVGKLAALQWRAWRTGHPPSASFYLLPARAWELLIGALLALAPPPSRAGARAGRGNQLASVAGFLLIAYSIVSFDESASSPLHLLLPTVGAALIIGYATPQTLVGRLLSSRPFVAVGLVSYSAYLWHQPLFAFARHRSFDPPGPSLLAGLAAASVVLAYFTWKYVETPFRDQHRVTRAQIVAGAAVCTTLVAAVGIGGQVTDGFASRVSPRVADVLRGKENTNTRTNICDAYANRNITPADACVFGNPDNVVAAVVGDSHANALAASLGLALAERGMGVKELAVSGCPCVDCPATFDCEYAGRAIQYLRTDSRIRYIVIAGRWALYFKRNRGSRDTEAAKQAYVRSLSLYLGLDKTIILLYPLPEVGANLVNRNLKKAWFGRYQKQSDLNISYQEYKADPDSRNAIDALDRLGEHSNLIRIRQDELLCDTFVKDRCAVESNGVRLYSDDSHLSNPGARIVADEIVKQIARRR